MKQYSITINFTSIDAPATILDIIEAALKELAPHVASGSNADIARVTISETTTKEHLFNTNRNCLYPIVSK